MSTCTYWRWSNFRQCAIEFCVLPRHPFLSPRSKCASLMWQLQQKPYRENILLKQLLSCLWCISPREHTSSWSICDTQALYTYLAIKNSSSLWVMCKPTCSFMIMCIPVWPTASPLLVHGYLIRSVIHILQRKIIRESIIFSTNVWIALPRLGRACSWLEREICWHEF